MINPEGINNIDVNSPYSPPPPHSGVGGTACVFPKSPVKGYTQVLFARQSPARDFFFFFKGVYLTFHPEISFNRFFFSLSLSLCTPEKFKKGVIKYLCLLYLKIIGKLIKSREQIPEIGGYIEQCSGFRGVSKAGKACEKPAKGGFRNCWQSWDYRGVLSKGGNKHTRTLHNTEWGGGGVLLPSIYCNSLSKPSHCDWIIMAGLLEECLTLNEDLETNNLKPGLNPRYLKKITI